MKLLFIDDMESTEYSGMTAEDCIRRLLPKGASARRIVISYSKEHSIPDQIRKAADRLEEILRGTEQELIVILSPDHGREYAGRLANRLGRKAVTNVETVSFEVEKVRVILPVYNGNLAAESVVLPGEYVLEMDINAMDPKQADDRVMENMDLQRLEITPPFDQKDMILQSIAMEKEDTIDIRSAENVLVIGHGFSRKEQVDAAKVFCEKTGFVLGGSRPVVIDGLLPISELVGMSGNRLHAEQCLLMGVSGASAFMEGIKYCKNVIAVNRDKDASVFKASHIGMVGDCHEILAEMNRVMEDTDGSE